MRKIFALFITFFLLFHCTAVSQDNVTEETQNPQIAELPQVIENHGEMVLVPEGEFLMGSNQDELKSRIGLLGGAGSWYILQIPKHNVTLPAYYIDKYEVTNQQFCEFLNFKGTHQEEGNETPWIMISNRTCLVYQDETGKYRTKEGYEKYPAVMVPTEAEWEKAAKGKDGYTYPWGMNWDADKCNNMLMSLESVISLMLNFYNDRGIVPPGSIPECASSYGVTDMAGNVMEWCSDWYDENYYEISPYKNPRGPETGTYRVIRGGSWENSGIENFRCSNRFISNMDRGFGIGFRCVLYPENL